MDFSSNLRLYLRLSSPSLISSCQLRHFSTVPRPTRHTQPSGGAILTTSGTRRRPMSGAAADHPSRTSARTRAPPPSPRARAASPASALARCNADGEMRLLFRLHCKTWKSRPARPRRRKGPRRESTRAGPWQAVTRTVRYDYRARSRRLVRRDTSTGTYCTANIIPCARLRPPVINVVTIGRYTHYSSALSRYEPKWINWLSRAPRAGIRIDNRRHERRRRAARRASSNSVDSQ